MGRSRDRDRDRDRDYRERDRSGGSGGGGGAGGGAEVSSTIEDLARQLDLDHNCIDAMRGIEPHAAVQILNTLMADLATIRNRSAFVIAEVKKSRFSSAPAPIPSRSGGGGGIGSGGGGGGGGRAGEPRSAPAPRDKSPMSPPNHPRSTSSGPHRGTSRGAASSIGHALGGGQDVLRRGRASGSPSPPSHDRMLCISPSRSVASVLSHGSSGGQRHHISGGRPL
mmetsp:Transcript_42565/g.121800  ORF Transcript_42565/g.121800 Transcript_42565/m.121800 type:complete len:224 (+) Transcript_42565:109-780(+)